MLRKSVWCASIVVTLALLAAPVGATVFDDEAVPSWQTNASGQVFAITSTSSAVYVGGSFSTVNNGVGGGAVSQAHLAAFDPATGALLPGFTPTLNGTVRSLVTTNDGLRLFVGGSFTNVNGSSISGIVELDPVTGDALSVLETGTSPGVFSMALDGDDLYVVGNINRVGSVVVTGAGRIDIATGDGDWAWRPTLSNGPVRAVAVQSSRARVFVGGYFESANGATERGKLVALNAIDGAIDADFNTDIDVEVFDLAVTDDKLYLAVGGPGGRGEVRDPVTGRLITAHVTDGDVQSVAVSDEVVFFGQHGELLNGSFQPWVFGIDRASDAIDTEFTPTINAGQGSGVWAVHDAGADLWLGGNILSANPVNGVGFIRFPAAAVQPDDTTAPSTPTGLVARVTTAIADIYVGLDWADSLDDSGNVYYRIERDGALVGTTNVSEFLDVTVDPAPSVGYTVTALDAAQNLATSTALTVTTLPPLTATSSITMGSTWHYLDTGGLAPAGWDLAGFDVGAWESGPAELGREDGDEVTVVDHPPAPSVTVYLRQEFDIPVGFTVAAAQLAYVRDDGVLIRINGVEVLRDNLPVGPIDDTTRALVWQTANEATVFTTGLDRSPFIEGTNVISVELHNASSSGDLSFAAALDLGLVDDTSPPTTPTALAVTATSDTTVSLAWTASTDDQGVTGYSISRDGVVVGSSPITSFTDTGLTAETAYSYSVVALDAAGKESPASLPLTATTDAGIPDTEAPTDPTGLTVLATGEDSVWMVWTGSTDNVGVTGYEVMRDGFVVATVVPTTHIDLALTPSTTYSYSVRAIDAAGNASAFTAPVSATTDAAPPTAVQVIAFGEQWSYLDTGAYPGANWVLPSFDDAGWPSGATLLGVGDGGEVTVIASRPTVWLRSTFDVVDPGTVVSASLDMIADDGAVVFVNGVEVIRDNVQPGIPDGSTPAIAYRFLAAEDQARTFDVPVGTLAAGTNTIAIALVNAPGSGDMSFDLQMETLIGVGGGTDVTAPTAPTGVTAAPVSADSATLQWIASVDDFAVAGYSVLRDGVIVGTSATTTSFVDSGLIAATAYIYAVEAFDAAGNISSRSTPLTVTTPASPPAESTLVPFGSTWSYLDNGLFPGLTWTSPAFDDAAWAMGIGPLAANNPGATTITNHPATWLRSSVDVPVAASVVGLEIDIHADDSAVVFINGVEVLRDNVGPGPVDGSMPALSYRWGAAETEVRTFVVPPGVLVDGANTIAVAMINGNGSGDSSIDIAVRQFVQP